jgi:hypothetical protein
MSSFETIWNEIFDKIRKNGELIQQTVAAEADFVKISPAQISRIKSGKSKLTDHVIEVIVKKVSEIDQEYAKTLPDKFKRVQFESIKENLGLPAQNDAIDVLTGKYSIERAAELFEKLSNPRSLLCVDYRDFPQATVGAAYPILAKKAAEAVKKGLRFALFQPFGSAKSLRNMIAKLNEDLTHPKVMITMKAYLYLYELALRVEQVYKDMKAESDGGLGQIVLYEAQIERPLITAIGLQSRLFLADYFEGDLHQRQIFEWVTAPNNEHFFIERSQLSLNIEAVRLQFHPIHKYWEESEDKSLPCGPALDKAYNDYQIEQLLGGVVKWKNWSESEEAQ